MRTILDTIAFLALCLMITGIVWQGLLGQACSRIGFTRAGTSSRRFHALRSLRPALRTRW